MSEINTRRFIENIQINLRAYVQNHVSNIQITGAQAGWKISDKLYRISRTNKPTNSTTKIVDAIQRRFFDVGINTLVPICLHNYSKVFKYFSLIHRAGIFSLFNFGRTFLYTYLAVTSEPRQFKPYMTQALKLLYRGGLDAALYGINYASLEIGVYMLLGEGVVLLIAPNHVRSLVNKVFGYVDNFIDEQMNTGSYEVDIVM
ncbi:MAG: hypothetical protein K1060chlam1_00551 [Candidatus Anoxychlamydiales bacterium]|nr:hypothetical protein [Candidatus Anoxychlamydiales bacterium]